MKLYADSSFIVPLYISIDGQAKKANDYMSKVGEPLVFTLLHRLEVRNAIRLYANRRLIDESTKKAALRQVEEDLEDGILAHATVNPLEVYRQADELSEKYGNCGTLDLLHIANALKIGATHFLTFDVRQGELAKKVGIKVHP
ncbi:MAG: type II toxin-antitoxin system VapC family toxin [bacterium]